MSVQLSHRSSIGGSTKRATKRHNRPQRTHISEIYEYGTKENHAADAHPSLTASPDRAIMSVAMLNQYNNLIEAENSLAFKTLPPVKVSYHSTKNKFTESTRGDTSSRIIRPHLTVKTHSPGHHIFTEGLSKTSIVRSPTFSLQKVGVPYSNLPDNISIHKEKDKFAFGVKREEYEKSPYRLTPRPFKTENVAFVTTLDADNRSVPSTDKYLKAKTGGSRMNAPRSSLEIKSNVIKLKPLVNMDKDAKLELGPDHIKVPSLALGPSKPPLAPRNSIHKLDSAEMKIRVEINHKPRLTSGEKSEPPVKDRKLSVVSIGENIEPNFYGNTKRETRQLYPMYDHKSKMNENYKKQLFEYSDPDAYNTKSKIPSSTFTYKVSTRAMSFVQDDSPDKFKPIRNNLRDSQGNLIHKQRGYRISSSLDDLSKSNSDYNFRKYYRRVFRRPKSTDTLSTDVSLVPGNPPPSEISHIYSEDGPIVINDLRNEMLPLVEERTMTASMISPRKDNTPNLLSSRQDMMDAPPNTKQGNGNDGLDTDRSQRTYLEEIQTCTDTDIQFENAVLAVERSNGVETGMSVPQSSLDTARIDQIDEGPSEIPEEPTNNPEKVESQVKIIDNKDTEITDGNVTISNVSINLDQTEDNVNTSKSATNLSVLNNSGNNESSVMEYIAEGEQRVKEHTLSAGSERVVKIDVDMSQSMTEHTDDQTHVSNDSKKVLLPKIKSSAGGSKHVMSVPKLSLDSAAHHPILDMRKEPTSLSRTLQNLTCADTKQNQPPTKNGNYSLKLDIEKSGEVNLKKSHIPVKRLRLFPDNSTLSNNTDGLENDVIYEALGLEVNIGSSPRSNDILQSEKKLVNNANVSFIYPSTGEIKAKRQ